MSIRKTVAIEILANTWPPGKKPPAELIAQTKGGPVLIDILSAMVFTAIWTRPPVRYGFSLSDTWAWLRYFPALSNASELRLCADWSTLDPHHKTVLSADFGVGFATWFLNRTLGFEKYSDTLWVVNTLRPGTFNLGRSAKRGPRKAPDFIAEDKAGNFSVLECKGSQSSRTALRKAIADGAKQKSNLKAVGSTVLHHSLVSGLFVPQHPNSEMPALMIADPTWDEVRRGLAEFTKDQIGRGVTQIAFAKELALLELTETPNTLARVRESRDSVVDAFREDLRIDRPGRVVGAEGVSVVQEYRWPRAARIADDIVVVGARFEADIAASEIERLQTIDSPENQAELKRGESLGRVWRRWGEGLEVRLSSPLGTSFRLELLEA